MSCHDYWSSTHTTRSHEVFQLIIGARKNHHDWEHVDNNPKPHLLLIKPVQTTHIDPVVDWKINYCPSRSTNNSPYIELLVSPKSNLELGNLTISKLIHWYTWRITNHNQIPAYRPPVVQSLIFCWEYATCIISQNLCWEENLGNKLEQTLELLD